MANAILAVDRGAHGVVSAPLFQIVKPYMAVAAVIVTVSTLIATIYFTLLDLEWIGFLAGIVFASILAMSTQAARSELAATDRGQKLSMAEYRLGKEIAERENLQVQLAAALARLQFSDELMPAMLAFVGPDCRYQYHNRAFAASVNLPSARVNGQHMRDVLGRKVFTEVGAYVEHAAAGHIVRYERTKRTDGGALIRLAVQYLPRWDSDGKYAGFHVVTTELPQNAEQGVAPPAPIEAVATAEAQSTDEKDDAWLSASRSMLAAIDSDEFGLLYQAIAPLAGDGPTHFEVLIRLLEEESGQIPPGAFFPLAEEHGLLPRLDRWVVKHVTDWIASPEGRATVQAGAMYFVNVAAATLADPDFPEFVETQLHRTGVPGASLCIEIAETDLHEHEGDAVALARALKQVGCRIAISGFGRNRATAKTLKLVPVDFLKIDGGIVRQILKYPAHHAQAVGIARMARALGICTVAEMVEETPVLDALRALGVDFAQGFGISAPRPLGEARVTASTPSSVVQALP